MMRLSFRHDVAGTAASVAELVSFLGILGVEKFARTRSQGAEERRWRSLLCVESAVCQLGAAVARHAPLLLPQTGFFATGYKAFMYELFSDAGAAGAAASTGASTSKGMLSGIVKAAVTHPEAKMLLLFAGFFTVAVSLSVASGWLAATGLGPGGGATSASLTRLLLGLVVSIAVAAAAVLPAQLGPWIPSWLLPFVLHGPHLLTLCSVALQAVHCARAGSDSTSACSRAADGNNSPEGDGVNGRQSGDATGKEAKDDEDESDGEGEPETKGKERTRRIEQKARREKQRARVEREAACAREEGVAPVSLSVTWFFVCQFMAAMLHIIEGFGELKSIKWSEVLVDDGWTEQSVHLGLLVLTAIVAAQGALHMLHGHRTALMAFAAFFGVSISLLARLNQSLLLQRERAAAIVLYEYLAMICAILLGVVFGGRASLLALIVGFNLLVGVNKNTFDITK